MAYVYYFENEKNEIIYVGYTKDIDSRMNTHFKNGHLENKCYEETSLVYYSKLNSVNEARIYELYYISKLKPKYNSKLVDDEEMILTLKELEFDNYDLSNLRSKNNNKTYEMIKNEFLLKVENKIDKIETVLDCLLMLKEYPDCKNYKEVVNKVINANVNIIKKEIQEIKEI